MLANNRQQLNGVRRRASLGIPSTLAGRGLGSVYGSAEASDVLAWLDARSSVEQGGPNY